MKFVFAVLALALSVQASAGQKGAPHNNNGAYPLGPIAEVTPGTLCDHPDEYRYPEKISYCKRDVDTGLKKAIIKMYDEEFGFQIRKMDRQDFKIDHYIPLCMGGSNDESNLWPQHKSVYELTDPLEQMACEKMAQGSLPQKKAVELIRRVKNDLTQVEEVFATIESL